MQKKASSNKRKSSNTQKETRQISVTFWKRVLDNSTDVNNPAFFEKQKLSQRKTIKFLWCVRVYILENQTKTSAINKPLNKRKSINTEKKSKTFEVMEFGKRKFDKLKPTALSQTQTIFAADNQRRMQKKRRSLSPAT